MTTETPATTLADLLDAIPGGISPAAVVVVDYTGRPVAAATVTTPPDGQWRIRLRFTRPTQKPTR